VYRAQVVCKGCTSTFETHQRARLFCCSNCNFAFRFAKGGYCVYCKAEVPFECKIGLDRNEPGTPLADFPAQHEPCRTLYLEERGRDDDCRCVECKARKGITKPIPQSKAQRRPTTHAKHRQTVLERDNFICQICDLPTDPDAGITADLYPTLDHIIRVVDGGDDSLDNLRTAHKWCNSALNASLFGEDWVRARAQSRFEQS